MGYPVNPPVPAAAAPPAGVGPLSGDVSALLRVMRPLHGTAGDPVEQQRRVFADMCRLIGTHYGFLATPPPPPPPVSAPAPVAELPSTAGLPPRVAEALRHLLTGDGEKQVAGRMGVSQHTVHGHVKKLYRHFNVSSRGELLALHVRR